MSNFTALRKSSPWRETHTYSPSTAGIHVETVNLPKGVWQWKRRGLHKKPPDCSEHVLDEASISVDFPSADLAVHGSQDTSYKAINLLSVFCMDLSSPDP